MFNLLIWLRERLLDCLLWADALSPSRQQRFKVWRAKMLLPGTHVRLHIPENPRLHNQKAVVQEITDYGAVVITSASGSGQYRAMLTEMVAEVEQKQAKASGYTGDVCITCGGVRMRRNSNCLLCEDCGSTSGCS